MIKYKIRIKYKNKKWIVLEFVFRAKIVEVKSNFNARMPRRCKSAVKELLNIKSICVHILGTRLYVLFYTFALYCYFKMMKKTDSELI